MEKGESGTEFVRDSLEIQFLTPALVLLHSASNLIAPF